MEETAPAALPDDVVIEVLARVADVAELFRCAMVCMRWRGLIADRSFLRRRWPENATHPSFLVGFFTQRQRCYGIEGNEDEGVADCDSPPVFIPAPRSVLGPGLGSLPAGLLDGAKPLIARRGLLLVRLSPVLLRSPVHLAVCDLLASTCDILPPLQWDHHSSSTTYAILTGEDFGSTEGHKPRTPAPDYSTFFKVLAMSFVNVYPGGAVVEYRLQLHTFSSADPGWAWAAPAKLLRRCDDGPQYCPYVKDDAVVCRRGMAHWLCGNWCEPHDLANCFTIDVSPEDDHVSVAKLSFLPIQVLQRPTTQNYHLATVDGTLMLFLLYTLKEGLWLDTWTRRDGTYWYRDRVIELKPPEKMRLDDGVPYLWSGEKSGTLLIINSDWCKYVAYLETGEMEEVSGQFRGMVREDAVPMEIDWPDLFMSRLARPLPDNRSML